MALVALPDPNPETLRRRGKIVAALCGLLEPENIIADVDGRRVFAADGWTAGRAMPLAVVLPTSTEDVSRVLAFCDGAGVKVVARGAGTSPCGAALPLEDAIVLATAKMTRVLDIDFENRTLCVETGITNQALTDAVADAGFFFAPDPWSRAACTLGGNIAMNAGGANALKYGVTTNHVLGIKIVLADGEVMDIGGPALEAPGYDILALINGSEGQLGVVTEATVRIGTAADRARPMLLGFASVLAAVECAQAINAAPITPVAMEFMDRPAIHLCEAFAKAGYPLDVEALLIVEVEGTDGEVRWQLDMLDRLARNHNPKVVDIAASEGAAVAIWLGWQGAYGAMARQGGYYCVDGTVPLSAFETVLFKIGGVAGDHGLRAASLFRAGDGTLRAFVLFDQSDPIQAEQAAHCQAAILELCIAAGGTISGENGIGMEKRNSMGLQFSALDLAQQMRIKSVFDPKWLLNPGKIFPLRKASAAPGAASDRAA